MCVCAREFRGFSVRVKAALSSNVKSLCVHRLGLKFMTVLSDYSADELYIASH